MGAGITIYNTNRKIQIDGAYKNLYLSRKISLSKAGTTKGTFAEGEILAAVGGVNAQKIDAFCENTTTGWTCTVNTYVSGMKVYVFSIKAPGRTHGIGLQVFDSSETLVFDSDNKHPRVIGFGNENYSVTQPELPAVAVAQNMKIIYTGYGEKVEWESVLESNTVFHPAVYGTYTERELRNVYHDPVWGYTGGGYDWQTGQYVPPSYGIVTEGYYSLEWVEVKKYGIIQQSYTEIVSEWVDYWVVTPYNWDQWTIENFRLDNASMKKVTISEGRTELVFGAMSRRDNSPVKPMEQKLLTKGIIVDTRSWLLLDVIGL